MPKAKVIKSNEPYIIDTEKLLRMECCGCGMIHYESFRVIDWTHIEIIMNVKKGCEHVVGIKGRAKPGPKEKPINLIDPKENRKYIMEIEEAHKKAGKSKLRFKEISKKDQKKFDKFIQKLKEDIDECDRKHPML